MKKTLKGLTKLFHFDEYVYLVLITSILGVNSAKGIFDWRFLTLILANWLAVGFAFMINDIEDAPDDALSSEESNRNPISAGMITPKNARVAALLVTVFSAVLFILLGTWPFILGVITLLLGYLYSYRGIRLKSRAFLDILSHALIFAGLQFLIGHHTYAENFGHNGLWPFIFVMSLSISMELSNKIHEIKGHRTVQMHHTVNALGEKSSHFLLILTLILCFFSGAIALVLIEIIPFWVFILTLLLTSLFIMPVMVKYNRRKENHTIREVIQKPLARAAALGLLLQYLFPWLDQILNLGLF